MLLTKQISIAKFHFTNPTNPTGASPVKATPIIPGLLYAVHAHGQLRYVSAPNGAAAIAKCLEC